MLRVSTITVWWCCVVTVAWSISGVENADRTANDKMLLLDYCVACVQNKQINANHWGDSWYASIDAIRHHQGEFCDSIRQCVRHLLFTKPRNLSTGLTVTTTPQGVASTLNTLPTGVQSLSLELKIDTTNTTSHVYKTIDVSSLSRTPHLKELWIVDSSPNVHFRYYFSPGAGSDAGRALQMRALHLNLMIAGDRGIYALLNQYKELRLLDLEWSQIACTKKHEIPPLLYSTLSVMSLDVLSVAGVWGQSCQTSFTMEELASAIASMDNLKYLNLSHSYSEYIPFEYSAIFQELQVFDFSYNAYLFTRKAVARLFLLLLLHDSIAVVVAGDQKPCSSWHRQQEKPGNATHECTDKYMDFTDITEHINVQQLLFNFDAASNELCNKILCYFNFQKTFDVLKEKCILKLKSYETKIITLMDDRCFKGFRFPVVPSLREIAIEGMATCDKTSYASLVAQPVCIEAKNLTAVTCSNNAECFTFSAQNVIANLSFNGAERITQLDISYNKILFKNKRLLDSFKYLRSLDISGNSLQRDALSDFCSCFRLLQVLKMADIALSYVDKTIFKSCTSVEYLDLSSNPIHAIELPDEMKNLNYLFLRNSVVSIIRPETRKLLERIMKKGIIDFEGNAFSCSCDERSLDTVAWIKTSKLNFSHKVLYLCHGTKQGGPILINNIDLDDLVSFCNHSFAPTLIASLFALLSGVCIAALVFIGYRYRYVIKTKVYQMKHFRRQAIQGNVYDCFVSYCGEDSLWVHNVLARTLESTYGFSLCLHYRDFSAHGSLADEILRHMKASRTIMLVISDFALRKHWTLFEINNASIISLRNKASLIIVKLGTINRPNAPELVKEMLDSKIYIEWPDPSQIWRHNDDGPEPSSDTIELESTADTVNTTRQSRERDKIFRNARGRKTSRKESRFWSKVVSSLYDNISLTGSFCLCCERNNTGTSGQYSRSRSDSLRQHAATGQYHPEQPLI